MNHFLSTRTYLCQTGKLYVDAKCQKAITAFYQLRRTTGKTWGYSPKVVHWLYTAAIRAMLSYAAVVWWTRVDYSTVDKQLEHVQRIACTSTLLVLSELLRPQRWR